MRVSGVPRRLLFVIAALAAFFSHGAAFAQAAGQLPLLVGTGAFMLWKREVE